MMACFFSFFFFFAKVVKYWQRPFIGTFSKRVLGTCIHAKNNLYMHVLVKDEKKMVAIKSHRAFHILTFMLHIHACYIR